MAPNKKTAETERPAEEVSGGTATDAEAQTRQSLIEFFERSIWPMLPPSVLEKPLKKRERERILGYGPNGV